MSSQRRIIRNDIVARLLNKTSVGDRVFPARAIPYPEHKLPAIAVYIPRERGQNTAGKTGPPLFTTTSTVVIEAIVRETGEAQVEETLDLLAEEIEQVLFTDPEFVAQFEQIANYDSQIVVRTEGAVELASVAMQVDLQFSDIFPPVVTDDFATLRLKTDVIDPAADPNVQYPGPDGRIEVDAEIEVETI